MKLLAIVAAALVLASVEAGAADVAFYNVCKDQLGSVKYSYSAETDMFFVRCPDGKIEIQIHKCRGTLAFDASYNVTITCPGARAKVAIIRGPYPR